MLWWWHCSDSWKCKEFTCSSNDSLGRSTVKGRMGVKWNIKQTKRMVTGITTLLELIMKIMKILYGSASALLSQPSTVKEQVLKECGTDRQLRKPWKKYSDALMTYKGWIMQAMVFPFDILWKGQLEMPGRNWHFWIFVLEKATKNTTDSQENKQMDLQTNQLRVLT